MAQLMRVNPAKASVGATSPDYLPDSRVAHPAFDAQP
jgi:hypothetical protein